jgi:hypothetical protein
VILTKKRNEKNISYSLFSLQLNSGGKEIFEDHLKLNLVTTVKRYISLRAGLLIALHQCEEIELKTKEKANEQRKTYSSL